MIQRYRRQYVTRLGALRIVLTPQAQGIFEDMLADLILDVTISAQREIKRGRVVCGTCGTR